jgi:hypothetical protein
MLATPVSAAAASAQVPAYAPPDWFSEGVALVKQKAPAADCELKYSGELWSMDYTTCRFEGKPVSGAVANGHCSAYVVPPAPYEVGYNCVIWFGALALHSCSRFSSAAPDAWRGGKFDANAPYTAHAELVECLEAESPGTQDVSKLSVKRIQSVGSSISVGVTCTERRTARATGRLTIAGGARSFKLKAASKTIAARNIATLRLALPKKARRAARRALRKNKQVGAKLAIAVVDAVGTRRIKHRTVRLRL